MTALQQSQWVLPSRVPEAVYTDRQEFLDYFYKLALQAKTQRAISTVLLGQRPAISGFARTNGGQRSMSAYRLCRRWNSKGNWSGKNSR